MRYKKDPDRLYIFLSLSLIIHLIIFLIFPYGVLRVLGNNGDSQEYGFMQMVEYRVEESQSNQNSNSSTVDNTQVSTEKVVEESEVTKEPEVVEEPEEVVEESEVIEEPDVVEEPEVTEEPEVVEDNLNTGDNEILTSEESDLEVAVDSNNERNEESSSGEGLEKNLDSSGENVVDDVVEESTPPPPPPPTAGELTIGAPPVAYPKDLVGQAVSGTVEIEVNIDVNGEIEELSIINSSGNEQMDRVAELTIRHGWKFRNYQEGYSMIITIDFMIDESGNPDVKVSQGNLVFR